MNRSTRSKSKEIRDSFLSTFFFDRPEFGYAEVEVNKFHIARQVNGVTGDFVYAIYTPEAYLNYTKLKKSYQSSRDVYGPAQPTVANEKG